MSNSRQRRIFIRDLTLMANIGIYPQEHLAPQPVLMSIDAWVEDLPVAVDHIDQVLSYELLRDAAHRVVRAGHIQLVETLVNQIADWVMMDSRIRRLRIKAEKTTIFSDAAGAGVEIERVA